VFSRPSKAWASLNRGGCAGVDGTTNRVDALRQGVDQRANLALGQTVHFLRQVVQREEQIAAFQSTQFTAIGQQISAAALVDRHHDIGQQSAGLQTRFAVDRNGPVLAHGQMHLIAGFAVHAFRLDVAHLTDAEAFVIHRRTGIQASDVGVAHPVFMQVGTAPGDGKQTGQQYRQCQDDHQSDQTVIDAVALHDCSSVRRRR
jgi:hypothetical protein